VSEPPPRGPRDLPPAVRERLAALAAAALPTLARADVPAPVAHLGRFTPVKRARLGAAVLVAALVEHPRFRVAVLEHARAQASWELDLDGPEPARAAAAAVLLADPRAAELVTVAAGIDLTAGLRAELAGARRETRRVLGELERVTAELARTRAVPVSAVVDDGADKLRQRLREQGRRLREATDALARSEPVESVPTAELDRVRVERDEALADVAAQRVRAERAEGARDVALRADRAARDADELRLALLLDTLGGVAAGLRHELGVRAGTTGARPADGLTGAAASIPAGSRLGDLAALDRALALTNTHLVVDGYNVTKTGYPQLELVAQRDRLVRDLGLLAARTSAEVTVVFDGAAVTARGGQVWARGVRVLFSAAGVIADDVVRDVVAAEPVGRPLVVASSDREVVDSVRASGAHTVASAVLVERLAR
jgi:predicted RNA-binding protein with PIN domain